MMASFIIIVIVIIIVIIIIIIIIILLPSGVKCPSVKNIKVKSIWSGHPSGFISSINVPRKAIELNRWIIILIIIY